MGGLSRVARWCPEEFGLLPAQLPSARGTWLGEHHPSRECTRAVFAPGLLQDESADRELLSRPGLWLRVEPPPAARRLMHSLERVMAEKNLKGLLLHTLKDVYFAEHEILK